MLWPKWVVPIAGSTSSALRAVCPFQPSHHAGSPARSRSGRKRDRFLVAFTSAHHGPHHPRELVGKRNCGHLGWPTHQQGGEPGPVPGTVDLGIADDGQRTGHEQAAQVAITLLADTAEPVSASARMLLGHQPDPGREVASRAECFRVSDAGDQGRGKCGADARNLIEPFARFMRAMPNHDLPIELKYLCLERL